MSDDDPNPDIGQAVPEDDAQDESAPSSGTPSASAQTVAVDDEEEQDFGVPTAEEQQESEVDDEEATREAADAELEAFEPGLVEDEAGVEDLENDQNFAPETESDDEYESESEAEPDAEPEPEPDLRDPDTIPLAEELGIENLFNPIFGSRGRIFSAAGPRTPVVEFTDDFVIMHPPQMPFSETGPSEDIIIRTDQRGVLLNELGVAKSVIGAKFNGNVLWYSGEQMEGTLSHYAIWFDQKGEEHKLYLNGQALTINQIYALRNKTHDGELSIFGDIQSD